MSAKSRESRVADARKVVALIYSHYLRELDSSAALELATHWQLTAIAGEGKKSRETTLAATEEVLARLDDSRDFEQNLGTFNEWRRIEAEDLKRSWPAIERIISTLSDAPDERGDILSSWSTAPPAWLSGAPWRAYAFLASLSSDYDQHEASFRFAMKCVEEGGHPRGYWLARAVMQLGAYDEEAAKQLCADSPQVTHPLLEAQRAVLREDSDAIIEHLDTWEAVTPHDAAVKALLLALAWNTKGALSKAIGLLENAYSLTNSSGVALLAAKLLLVRATGRHTETRLRDAQKSLSLSLQARNSRRQWHGDSTSPLIAAIQAAIISGDTEKAWHLTQPTPTGDATPSEAVDAEVVGSSALVAALTGRFEAAERLLENSAIHGFRAAQVRALIAEARSEDTTHNVEVEALWRAAWDLSEDDQDRLVAAMGIAETGGTLPDLSSLADCNSEAVEEIRSISRALAAPGAATVSLRANAHKSRIVAVKLAQRLHAHGDVVGAADALLAASARWRDAQLAAMAAGRYQEAGLLDKARDAAQSALSKGGMEWAGAGRMYALLIEVESASGNLDMATSAARNLLAIDENDEDARWALIRCLMLSSEIESAWHAMQHRGEPVSPRNQTEAIIWINLNARFSVDTKLAGKALQLMKRWPDDERLLGVFIGVLLTGLRRPEVCMSSADSALLRQAVDDFLARFPDSRVFSAITVRDESDPLSSIAEHMRDHHERLREIRQMASSGAIPVGLIGEVVGRSYTETSLLQSSGYVYAVAPEATNSEPLPTGLPDKVVLDVTAAHTLALLDDATAEGLVGRIADLITTDAFYRDALEAYESLSLQSDMTVLWDEEAAAPSVHIRSADERERLIRQAQRIYQTLGSARRVPWLELRNFTELSERTAGGWLTGLDYAKSEAVAFWSDDRVLRSVGREKGVVCFGTFDMVRYFERQGVLTKEERVAIEALLIQNHYVDIPYRERVFELAALGDGWRARGVTYSLTRPYFWRQPQIVMRAVLHAIEKIWREDPSEITGWIASAGIGLAAVGGDAEAAGRNLTIFLRNIIAQSWLQASTLPYVLDGFRQALSESPGAANPVQTVIAEFYAVLVQRLGHVTAASYLLDLFSNADAADKAIASRVVLLHK